jgi:phosphonate transport system substrate-binding protein
LARPTVTRRGSSGPPRPPPNHAAGPPRAGGLKATTLTVPDASPAALRIASFLGDNAHDFYRQVIDYVAAATGLPAAMVPAPPDQALAFERAELEAAFSCGLPYVWQAAGERAPVRLLAAPVLPGARYAGRPVYFADFIVRTGSRYQRLDDLRGAAFAYNQSGSFSGYVLPRYHLHSLGRTLDFFGRCVESGSHARSMDWVESGQVDCAAIDSVVLAMELRQRPARALALRVVASSGPAAMPPVIAAARLPAPVQAAMSAALVNMHTQPAGQAVLQQAGVLKFVPVTDAHYEDIRQMLSALAAADAKPHSPAPA